MSNRERADRRAGPADPRARGGAGRRFLSRARAGSSLIEMLVALVVLGVVLISMVGMFLISRAAIYTKEDETANAIALRYLEECESLPFAALADEDFTATETFANGKYTAEAETTAVDPDDSGGAYSATITVTVTWQAAGSGERSISLERVISAGGHKNVGELN